MNALLQRLLGDGKHKYVLLGQPQVRGARSSNIWTKKHIGLLMMLGTLAALGGFAVVYALSTPARSIVDPDETIGHTQHRLPTQFKARPLATRFSTATSVSLRSRVIGASIRRTSACHRAYQQPSHLNAASPSLRYCRAMVLVIPLPLRRQPTIAPSIRSTQTCRITAQSMRFWRTTSTLLEQTSSRSSAKRR